MAPGSLMLPTVTLPEDKPVCRVDLARPATKIVQPEYETNCRKARGEECEQCSVRDSTQTQKSPRLQKRDLEEVADEGVPAEEHHHAYPGITALHP